MSRRGWLLLTGLLIIGAVLGILRYKEDSPLRQGYGGPTPHSLGEGGPAPHSLGKEGPAPRSFSVGGPEADDLRKQFESQLSEPLESGGLLKIPKRVKEKPKRKPAVRKPKLPPPADARAKGRQERARLPLGVVLWDDVNVYEEATGNRVLFKLKTGDFVRVFPDAVQTGRLKMQPGVDLYLAATSKQFEAAGNRLPDKAGWVRVSDLHVFEPEPAIQFTQETVPVTLGEDPLFSTLGFYERAFKNPDPVVHRVIGPRLIELLSVHEDYVPTWGILYRDPDSKIRSVTLAALHARGVGNNRQIIEDLIKRLAELTRVRAQDEAEVEVLAILKILQDSGHPRVNSALLSFKDTWANTQNDGINKEVEEILGE